ncbi:capsular polysaccharide export protein [Paraburkholderia caballeronis]|uniref:capsule biosynthesis protein n=1 Tax=Paraburkholderia caballeronis TaxID=416943 RepID=UPI0010EE5886|nr:capsular biosynthesis protein [Paraburkholderia caballeronis]TDV37325.1 capsular polysaccharide export protein [Paraburkholderia caballeronis]
MMQRKILFLQGPPSLFWRQLCSHFQAAGAETHRINFSLGDWAYWRKRGAVNYRGRFSRWAEFLRHYLIQHGITDILYYADRLPYHAVARELAQALGIRTYAVEFGYLRPHWITLERGGMGSLSHFPDDPDVIRAIAKRSGPYVPSNDTHYHHTFGQEAFNEVLYNLLTSLVPYFFPLYRPDKRYWPLVDYLSWPPSSLFKKLHDPRRVAVLDQWQHEKRRYWLMALQIQADYQLRANSHYEHQSHTIEEVIASFARHARAEDCLVIKLHPLDNGLERWHSVTARIAKQYGVAERVLTVHECDLNHAVKQCQGVVTVNSTVGLISLRAHKPVKALGVAVYDVAGLTHQGPLDTFWQTPEPVDHALLTDFISALAATIQVRGSFYNEQGRKAASEEIVRRVLEDRVNGLGAFVTPPPRLARALRNNVPIHGSLRKSGIGPAAYDTPETRLTTPGTAAPANDATPAHQDAPATRPVPEEPVQAS